MQTFYSVTTQFLNGTVTMHIEECLVPSEDIAKKVAKAIEEANKDSVFRPWTTIRQVKFYETEQEIPILCDKEQ